MRAVNGGVFSFYVWAYNIFRICLAVLIMLIITIPSMALYYMYDRIFVRSRAEIRSSPVSINQCAGSVPLDVG